ncbi:MAG: gamma carbonic anhydrase family protein [Gammaproteobacteria bacterium]|nr:gamma carbonic anhydrase family protein [Gammaproteobacteria bacterium]
MTIRNYLEHTPTVPASTFVDESAQVIGNVTIGEDASIWPMAVARGDVQSITIGARTNIQDGSVLHVTQDNRFNPGGFALTIGAGVTVGHSAVLHACTIGDFSLIGMGAIVLDGAVVPSRTMIGAGSLVAPGKTLETGYLWIGRPARRQRVLTDNELEYLEYSAAHYVDLKNKHMQGI